MNPVLLKSLVGVGSLGTLTAVSVGGYYLMSSSPKTIGDKLKEKTPVGPFMESNEDNANKQAWTEKMNSYKTANASDEKAKKILAVDGITEKALSDKCQEILKTSLSDSSVAEKEKWAASWCFKQT